MANGIKPETMQKLFECDKIPQILKDVVQETLEKSFADDPEKLEMFLPGQKIDMPVPRTQKALGVMELARQGFDGFSVHKGVVFQSTNDSHFADEETFERVCKSRIRAREGEDLFIRYCPVSPRHGFIDSYKYKFTTTQDLRKEIEKSLKKLMEVDPSGELIVMRFIDSSSSVVLTPGRISIGISHDGATAGKGVISVEIPEQISPKVDHKRFGIKEGEHPYFEIVLPRGKNELCAVQVRSGPRVDGFDGSALIPNDFTCREVITVTDKEDLEGWWNKMQSLKDVPGLAIYHPGGNITSHWSACAVMNSVPVFLSEKPVVGRFYRRTENAPSKEYDIENIVRGIRAGLSAPARIKGVDKVGQRECVAAVLAAHCSAIWKRGDSAFAFGAGAAWMWRCAAAACLGEHRHKSDEIQKKISHIRNIVYEKAFSDIPLSVRALRASLESFASDQWSSSYGGIRWAECNAFTIDLEDILLRLLTTDSVSQQDIQNMSHYMHGIVNVSHNCGKFLTKYVDTAFLDSISNGGTPKSIHGLGVIHEAHTLGEDEGAVNQFVNTKRPECRILQFWNHGTWKMPEHSGSKKKKSLTYNKTDLAPSYFAQFRILDPGTIRVQIQKTNSSQIVDADLKEASPIEIPMNLAAVLGKKGSPPPKQEKNSGFIENQHKMPSGLSSAINLSGIQPTLKSMVESSDARYFPAEVEIVNGKTNEIKVFTEIGGKKFTLATIVH